MERVTEETIRLMGSPETYEAITARLFPAFELVRPPENWKFPINAVVKVPSPELLATIREAVIFYTGSVPTFIPIPGTEDVQVRAAGYYVAIGA